MEQRVAAVGLTQSLMFAGYVPRVADFYRNTIDINVLASDEEGLGLVLLEGGVCGMQSIGTDCTGIREVIRDGHNGYLFRQGDAQSLAHSLTELATDAERRAPMGRAAREFVEQHFSAEGYAAGIAAVIDDLAASFQSGGRPSKVAKCLPVGAVFVTISLLQARRITISKPSWFGVANHDPIVTRLR